MSRTVAKGSYIRGAGGKARAKAHVNYLQYRRGEDREDNQPRVFFNRDRDNIQGREVKEQIDELGRAPVTVHKLILSPGLEGIDLNEYTREVLEEVSRGKGLDLEWYAVNHKNTDHDHAHVVIFGKDQNGRAVKFDREDFQHFREAGDRYLDREHFWERRQLRDRDPERVLKEAYSREGDWDFQKLVAEINRKPGTEREEPEQAKELERTIKPRKEPLPWDKEKAIARLPQSERIEIGGTIYTKYSPLESLQEVRVALKNREFERIPEEEFSKLCSWIGTKKRGGDDFYELKAKEKWDRKHKTKEERDIDEHRRMDKDLAKQYEHGQERYRKMGRGQRSIEGAGKLAESHGHYSSLMEIKRLQELAEQFPDLREEYEKQMEAVKEFDRQQSQDGRKDKDWNEFDALLGERWKSPDEDPNKQIKGKDRQQNQGADRQQQQDQLQQPGDAWETHEADRQVKELIDPVRQDQERDEDSFGRNER